MTDGGRTWHRAAGRAAWTPSTLGPATILSRAADDSGNIQSVYGSTAVTVTPQPTGTSSLVGAWSFNAGSGTIAADTSGLANDGMLGGPAWTAGFSGGGLLFDGIDDWVTVSDSNSLDLTSGMTLEAWLKPTAPNDWRSAILKEQAKDLAYGLYSSNAQGIPEGDAHIGIGQATPVVNPLTINSWTHLATTYDGASLKLYVNGTLVSTRDVIGAITTSTNPLRFGGNVVWGEYFHGVMDEVRIYNRRSACKGTHV